MDKKALKSVINLIVFISITIALGFSVASVFMTGDYSGICSNGIVYVIPCLAECLSFILIDGKDEKAEKIAFNIASIIAIIDIIYIIVAAIWMYIGVNEVFAFITIIVSMLYPLKDLFFAVYYYELSKK